MLIQLPHKNYHLINKIGKINEFPIIASVVYLKQKGEIYVDDIADPKIVFIIHKSAFCYFYSLKDELDYKEIFDFLYRNIDIPQYFHIYDANESLIKYAQQQEHFNIKIRKRMRMNRVLNLDNVKGFNTNQFTAMSIDKIDIEELYVFDLKFIEKYWGSVEDFITNGFGWVILYNGKPVSIFYTVSIVNNSCEGDIFTLPEFRGKGLASIAESLFLKTCSEKNIIMGGDVFIDNIPSIKMQENFGYKPSFYYDFLSLFKKN